MDAFYASVEQRDNPELRGKPLAVGGAGRRGVVASCSYEARKYGVRSAMPGSMARRLCPGLIFVKSRFEVYREVSKQIRNIFFEYTDLVEPLSLDEAYLDVTEPKTGPLSATLIAQQIRQRIVETTGLTASAGVSFNKFLAKVASDINKPNGIKIILPEEADAFLEALPIEKFHGIGRVTAERMRKLGIHTGADLKNWPEIDLVNRFGKVGRYYYRIVRAEDNRPVNPHHIRKSIGAERTFDEDLSDITIMKEKLSYLSGIVFEYMQRTENYGRTLTVKIKTADFRQITRSKSFAGELRLVDDMISTSHELLEGSKDEFESIRLLGVAVSNLSKEHSGEGIQLRLPFEEKS